MEARPCTTQTLHCGYLPAITEEERAEALKYHSKCIKSTQYRPVRETPMKIWSVKYLHSHTGRVPHR